MIFHEYLQISCLFVTNVYKSRWLRLFIVNVSLMIKTQNGKQTSATAVKVSSPILYVCAQNFAKTTSKYTDRQQKVTAFTVVFTLIKKMKLFLMAKHM